MTASASLQPFAPQWSAEQLAAAVPRALPALHRFEFVPPANAAELHRPRRRIAPYAAPTAPTLFRIRS